MTASTPSLAYRKIARAQTLIEMELRDDAIAWLGDALVANPNQRSVWHFLFSTLVAEGTVAPIPNLIAETIDQIEDP